MAEVHIGSFRSWIVGIAHAEAEPEPGETVRLQREPDNPHDTNAIRVLDSNAERCGYLPREDAAWLAPLLDRGWITLTGRVLEGGSPGFRARVELEVTITPKGARPVLEPPRPPLAPAEAAHARVLEEVSAGRLDRRTARRLERRLAAEGTPLLPETRLLLRLAADEGAVLAPPGSAAAEAGDAVRLALAGIEPAAPRTAGRLTVVPLLAPRAAVPPLRPLAEALESGDAAVEEAGREGTVPELVVRNTGAVPVFVPLGVILVGGKQDRMVAEPVVVAPGASRRIPVRCVERGRWHRESDRFRVAAAAPAAVRRRAAGAAWDSQEEVWREVASCLEVAAVDSPTESLEEAMAAVRPRVRPAVDAIELPDGACGIAAFAGRELLGIELRGSPHLFRPERDALLEAFAFDAELRGASGRPDPDAVRRTLDHTANGLRTARRRGPEIALEGRLDRFAIRALVYRETLVALSVMAVG